MLPRVAIRVVLGEDSYLVREGCSQVLAGGAADRARGGVRRRRRAAARDRGAAARRRADRHPDAADAHRRGHPAGRPPARDPSGDRRRRAQPVRRSRLRARAARVRLRRPGLPAQGARPRPRASSSRRSRRSPSGESVIDPKIVEVLVAAKARGERSPLAELTPRELEVLAAIAEGKSNAAISEALVLTKRAVEKHINAIFLKLNLSHSQAPRTSARASRRRSCSSRVRRRVAARDEGEARTPADQGARAIVGLHGRPRVGNPTEERRMSHAPQGRATSPAPAGWPRSLGGRERGGPRPHSRRPGGVPRRSPAT